MTTDEKVEKIISLIRPRLKKALEINQTAPQSIDPHKPLLFILDKFIRGNYYGTIAVKIVGTSMHNPKELEVTHRLDLNYEG